MKILENPWVTNDNRPWIGERELLVVHIAMLLMGGWGDVLWSERSWGGREEREPRWIGVHHRRTSIRDSLCARTGDGQRRQFDASRLRPREPLFFLCCRRQFARSWCSQLFLSLCLSHSFSRHTTQRRTIKPPPLSLAPPAIPITPLFRSRSLAALCPGAFQWNGTPLLLLPPAWPSRRRPHESRWILHRAFKRPRTMGRRIRPGAKHRDEPNGGGGGHGVRVTPVSATLYLSLALSFSPSLCLSVCLSLSHSLSRSLCLCLFVLDHLPALLSIPPLPPSLILPLLIWCISHVDQTPALTLHLQWNRYTYRCVRDEFRRGSPKQPSPSSSYYHSATLPSPHRSPYFWAMIYLPSFLSRHST